MSSHKAIVSSFVEWAPPGEVSCRNAQPRETASILTSPIQARRCPRRHESHLPARHIAEPDQIFFFSIDIKALTISNPNLVDELGPAFEKYNEEQFTTVKLPGSSQPVIVSSHNSLGGGRYYDVESSSSFTLDHTTQKASAVQSHVLEGTQAELV